MAKKTSTKKKTSRKKWPKDTPVRVGFCGVGGMGQCAHLRNYACIPECEVVAVSDIREKTGRRVAEKYGVPYYYSSAEEMLENEELDAVVASQPFNRHGVLLPMLLKAGVPVFTEKPLCASVEVGKKIVKEVKKSGTFHMVGYHKRSDPATMYAKDVIDEWRDSGELGPMKYVRISMPPGQWIAEGFWDLVDEGDRQGGLECDPPPSDMDAETQQKYTGFVNYYIHQVNLLRHLLCESYSVDYADPSGALFVAHSKSGVCGTIEMATYTTSIDWQEHAFIGFQKGWIRIDLPAPVAHNRAGRVTIYRDGNPPTETTPTLPWVHAMKQQALNFLAAVRGEREPLCDAEEALEDLVVARNYIKLFTGK